MNYKNTHGLTSFLMFLVLALISVAIAYAANNVEPSKPTTISFVSNSTNAYPNGTLTNYTRGYIHTINIDEKQPTFKWAGFVGNVTGRFALQDSEGYALYDWTIVTTTGEIYATREGPAHGDSIPGDGGGIPDWENMACANLANLTAEQGMFNHTVATGARANEDAYLQTFTTSVNFPNFYIGETAQITNGSGCYGVNLNTNDSHSVTPGTRDWAQVVLMDQTFEVETGPVPLQWDIIYAVLIQNNSFGYRNGTRYDWQMLLPESGLEGSGVGNQAYYFYIELI